MKAMRSTILLFFLITIVTGVLAQSPFIFKYQAVLRNASGQVIASEDVDVKIVILQGSVEGTEVFSETHQTQTNEFGLINLQIGSINSLADIEWAGESYYIEVSVDGQIMGASQLLSVPYALHSQTSADAFSGDYADLENLPDLSDFVEINDPQNGDMVYYKDDAWQSIVAGEEGQVLMIKAGEPQWSDVTEEEPETVTDIDGNEYKVVTIGSQKWMADNLRTTTYLDGTEILGSLSNTEWGNTTVGAYAVYSHENVGGIDSEEEMIDAYGLLYNWFAIAEDTERGLCPVGWHVPTDDDWDQLLDYLLDEHGIPNENVLEGASNALKNCRQVDSPLGGVCDTEEHPRWNFHDTHYGTDYFGFSAIPGGARVSTGAYTALGMGGHYYTSSEDSETHAWRRTMFRNDGNVLRYSGSKVFGFSVRCVRPD
jgi:uncharacterized protein (TIGR02145 family)